VALEQITTVIDSFVWYKQLELVHMFVCLV